MKKITTEEMLATEKALPISEELLYKGRSEFLSLNNLLVKDGEQVINSIENCMKILYLDPVLRGAICRNELTNRIVFTKAIGWNQVGAAFTDVDECYINWYFEKQYGITNAKKIKEAINIIASENSFHPVKRFLESLKWDGTPRIDNMLTRFLGADDTDYVHEVMHLLMQAMIHRIYVPGAKYDIMVCLVGGQGAGKSTFFRLLTMRDEWFSDDIRKLDDDKVYQKLQGHWLMEMSEMLATANAKSIEDIKAFLSRTSDNYRVPYQAHPEDRPRQCVFVGTTNNKEFLPLDRTGNRRFAPIEIHSERVEKHILEDENESREYIKMAWAEAMHIYLKTKQHVLKLSRETELKLTEIQDEFMPEDTLTGQILGWLESCGETYVCSKMIYDHVFQSSDSFPPQWSINEINRIMNSLTDTWEKVSSHRFADYKIQRGWKRIVSEGDDFIPVPMMMEMPFE